MNTYKPIAPVGDPPYDTPTDMYAGLRPLEAELALHHAENFGPSSDEIWDDVVAMVFRLDSDDDDMRELKDELELFRRENDFERD